VPDLGVAVKVAEGYQERSKLLPLKIIEKATHKVIKWLSEHT
jgi:hypothetical protein